MARLPPLLLAVASTAAAAALGAFSGAARAQPSPPPGAAGPRLQPSALAQIGALAREKAARTPAQRKMDSHLLYALLRQRQDPRLAGLPRLRLPVPALDGTVEIDVQAVSAAGIKPILSRLHRLGARILGGDGGGGGGGAGGSARFRYATLRARLPLAAAEAVAAMPEVRFVRRASRPILEHFDSEGDATHRAAQARAFFGVDGAGVKICVLSDGVDSLAELQTAGDLPAVDVLAGQAGSGDEGTAMLEIVHDLAPGAALGFATAQPDEATFAANVLALRGTSACDVLVDDVAYLSESPFQDGIVADAVNQVTAAGALYFSSAGNEGNLDAGTSGTWEGDFKANGNLDAVLGAGAGATHDFGDGGQSDLVTADTEDGVVLHWADPAGASCNDYDLYVLDNSLSTVLEVSNDTQSCTQDPVESVGNATAGERVVVVLASGAGRMFNVLAFRGQLQLATAGCTRGHSSAAAAFGVAAAPAAAGIALGEPAGPFPNPFDAAQLPEPFTCDGPRRIFFDAAGNLLPGAPPGNFSSTGGVVRQKPDLTAADGVSTDVNNFRPFFGTSAAAPHAAAIAGLLRSALPALPPDPVRAAATVRGTLTGSAIDILAPGWDRDSGFGIAMAYQALQAAGAQPRPVLALGAVTPTEVTAGGDTAVDPGEDWRLDVALQNVGGAATSLVSATLSTTTPGVGITNGVSPYPDLAAGGSGANTVPFLFTPYAVPCGQPIQLTLTVTFAGGAGGPAVFTFTVPTGHPGAPATASYGGPVVPIPDGGNPPGALNEFPGTPAVAPLAVAGVAGRVWKLVLSLDGTACTAAAGATTVGVDHTFVNDLTFDLQSPLGTTVRVISRVDLEGHNFCRVTLDDDSPNPSIQTVASFQAPFTGTWQPDTPLAAFKGEDPNGTWSLVAVDHFGQDTGNIRAFSLAITPVSCPAAPALGAHLTATKAVTGGNRQPAGTVTYTVTLANSGTGATFDEPGDEFTDTLPASLALISAAASLGAVTTTGNTVHWNGGVPAGGSVVLTIQAAIGAGVTSPAVVSNQATVHYDATRSGTNQTTVATADPLTGGPTTFVVGAIAAVPALSGAGMAAMAAALLAAGMLALRRRRRHAGRHRPWALLLTLACGTLAGAAAAGAVEGKWTPRQVVDQDFAAGRSLGLELPPEKLWRRQGGGLLAAAVRVGGCSAGFVSPDGLLITNHHCAFGILQQHSTPDRDLIERGFLAGGRDQELAGANLRATVPDRTTDVTAAVEAAAALAGADDLARYQAIERKRKELVAACEHRDGAAARRCEVAVFDGGVRYELVESLEYADVRLVYAPPRSIGDFGGEQDNWSWPRHAGDFALLRVYAGPDGRPAPHAAANRPLRPPHFFRLAARGIGPGDFVMVVGYPGLTFRSLIAPEMHERADLFLPHRAALLRGWLDIMEAAAAKGAAARIALADRIKSLANLEKNARGQIAGLRRGHILEQKQTEDRGVLDRAAAGAPGAGRTRPPGPAAGPAGPAGPAAGSTGPAAGSAGSVAGPAGSATGPAGRATGPAGPTAGPAGPPSPAARAYAELTRLVEGRLATWDRDFLLGEARLGPKPLDLAMILVRHAREAVKSDLEREPPHMDRNRDRLADGLRRDQARLDPPAEAALLADLLARFAALPEATRLPAVERLLAQPPGAAGGGLGTAPGAAGAARGQALAALPARAASILGATRVTDLDERLKMLDESEAQLLGRHDPLLDLAAGLDDALRESEQADHRYRGAVSRLRPVWRRAVAADAARAGRQLAADANGTLRVSFARVQGYRPRDAVRMEAQTRLAGLVEKQTGQDPFAAPEALLAAAAHAPASPWADRRLHDVPVCFLADADTTGGSSGSPVLNARGELVGVNFDRVWENVANDFGYDPEVARSIAVDVRYLLWVLTTLEGEAARPLLRELLPPR